MFFKKSFLFFTCLSIGSIYADSTVLQLLYDTNIVRHGSFLLKNGTISPIYIDMRMAISSPELLSKIAQSMYATVEHNSYDRICGVPYGALPLSVTMALQHTVPLIMVRKEIKTYGTQKQIEGQYFPGDHVLLIEDVITSGSSILETIEILEAYGLIIKDIVVFLDRQEGGVERLRALGYSVHAVYTLHEVLAYRISDKK